MDAIKTRFVSSILTQSAEKIRERQGKVVNDWNLFKTDELRKSLTGHFGVNSTDTQHTLVMRYLRYARFLDIPDKRRKVSKAKREGYHLYNRIVFGLIYNYTMPQLKYGYTDEIKESISKELNELKEQS